MADPLAAFVSAEHADALRSALTLLVLIPESELQDALRRIETAQAVGPLLDPSAWTDGARFRNADDWRDVFSALVVLRAALPAAPTPQPEV